MARAVEITAVPLLGALAGRYLDNLLGTSPALTIVLLAVGTASAGARVFYEYAASMDELDRGAPWRRE